MRHCLFLIALFLAAAVPEAFGFEDPFQDIQRTVEPNGLTVVLAPSSKAKTFQIKVVVGAGFNSESRENAGISHLLEHLLFTDSRLKDDLSYLELIKEKGGTANGTTRARETEYFIRIPAKHARWATETLYSMLFKRTFTDSRVAHARKPVLVEIGEPKVMDWLQRFGLGRILHPEYFRNDDFASAEFGIRYPRHQRYLERTNTVDFTAEQVSRYYQDYYHPGNVTLLLAGNFDPKVMQRLLPKLYGSLPAHPSGKTMPLETPTPRLAPRILSTHNASKARFVIGTKLWDLEREDFATLAVYYQFLAHRMMKELRNKRGDTYTVSPHLQYNREGYGVTAISLGLLSDQFYRTRDYLRELIRHETIEGRFSETLFREAVSFALKSYQIRDFDSRELMRLAEDHAYQATVFKRTDSYYKLIQKLRYDEFISRLKKHSLPERRIDESTEVPHLGYFEPELFLLAWAALLFAVIRKVIRKPFSHSAVHWVRKAALPPFYMGELLTLAVIWWPVNFVESFIGRLAASSSFLQQSYLSADYLPGSLSVLTAAILGVGALAHLPKKLIISGTNLYLKSVTYHSTVLPIHEIAHVSAISPWRVLLSPGILRVKWRYLYFNPLFWQKGLLLELQDGRAYFLSPKAPDDASRELSALLLQERSRKRDLPAAA